MGGRVKKGGGTKPKNGLRKQPPGGKKICSTDMAKIWSERERKRSGEMVYVYTEAWEKNDYSLGAI